MKKLLLAILLLCGVYSKAQIFAPPGAIWEYKYITHLPFQESVKFLHYNGDTLFHSLNCHKVGNMIFYSDTCRIYYYNDFTSSFNKIYDYSMNIGDSLYIYHKRASIGFECDSGFYVDIVGKGIDTINARPYRYIKYESNWDLDFEGGKYYEKLGFLSDFFLNQTLCQEFDDPYYTCLRAYTDSSFVGGLLYDNRINCPITTDVNETSETLFSIYPNPSNGVFQIQSKQPVKFIEVVDMLGKTVLSMPLNGSEVNLRELPQGMYAAKVVFTNGRQSYTRLVIQ